jgi:hypothetical protein
MEADMYRSLILAACAALFGAGVWAQTTVSPNTIPPPPPSLNGQPPALEIPRQPPPIPPPGSPLAAVDQKALTVFDCERLERARQPLPLDCRSGVAGR